MHAINPKTPKKNPTQESSRNRVKTDSIDIHTVYEKYNTEGIEDFRVVCRQAIQSSSGKQDTKSLFVLKLDQARTKASMLFLVNNYYMSGNGLGV